MNQSPSLRRTQENIDWFSVRYNPPLYTYLIITVEIPPIPIYYHKIPLTRSYDIVKYFHTLPIYHFGKSITTDM